MSWRMRVSQLKVYVSTCVNVYIGSRAKEKVRVAESKIRDREMW